MKKLLLSSIVLFLFSASIMLFQISCQKQVNANPNQITQQNKFVYAKLNATSDIWTINICNIDGTNNTVVPISLPSGVKYNGDVAITADGSKIIFSARNITNTNIGYLYSCNIDGSGLTKILDSSSDPSLYFNMHPF